MKFIRLSKGKKTIVDDVDFEWLNQWKWHYMNGGYAMRTEQHPSTKKKKGIYMHREIMMVKSNKMVDHINHNKLDNRKINLRECVSTENLRNKRPLRDGYKGVTVHTTKHTKVTHKAQIMVNGKNKYLGVFESEKLAAIAYNKAAEEYFGAFAYLNKI